jgi:uncharacterized membrane protein
MADLIAVVFPSEEKAEEIRNRLIEMQREYLIEMGDAAIAVKGADGRVKLNQLFSTTAAGAAGGTMWGALIGLLFLNPLLGAAAGAASGAIAGALTDVGVNDKFMKAMAEEVNPGDAVLFVLVRKVTGDKVLAQLKGVGGRVLHTSLDETREGRLREALAAAAEDETAA